MGTTFYIHIGVHKTGTKSIQQTFADNRERLLKAGINYLPGDPNHGPALISLLSDNPHEDTRNIRRHVDTPEKAASYNAWTRRGFMKALARNRSPKMVISGEGLSGLSDEGIVRLKAMLAPYAQAFRIVVYVRDPYEYANSASLQRLKSGAILGATDRRMPMPNYRRRVGRYIRAFGRQNVDIRIFDPKGFIGGDLVTDFLVAIGESPQLAQELTIARANQSMSHEAAMILSETNIAIPATVDGRANRERAFELHSYVAEIAGEKFTIEPETYREYEHEILADLEWLHDRIGEPVFGKSVPRPASTPRWSEATVSSIKKLVSKLVSERQELEKDRRLPRIDRPALPAGFEWLQETYGGTASFSAPPRFERQNIRALGTFLHTLALDIQHLSAERAARERRWLVLVNPRAAENRLRDIVRLNPADAAAQFWLSVAHLLSGDAAAAQTAAESAVQLAPERGLFKRWHRLVQAAQRWLPKPSAPMRPAQAGGNRPFRRRAASKQPGGQGLRR